MQRVRAKADLISDKEGNDLANYENNENELSEKVVAINRVSKTVRADVL